MDSRASKQPSTTTDPPELWNAKQFGVFRERFSVDEQRELLQDDAIAQTRVSAVLALLIAMGTLLAIGSVLIIALG